MRQLMGMAFLILSVGGCQEKLDPVPSSKNIDDSGDGGDASLTSDPVTYTGHIQPILDRSCVGCHSTDLGGKDRRGAPLGADFNTYRAAKESASDANVRIQAGVMPPGGPLPGEEKTLFQKWIDDGLLE